MGGGSEVEGHGGREVDGAVGRMMRLSRWLYPSTPLNEERVREVLVEAYKVGDLLFGAREAADWGKEFVWDPGVFVRDLSRLQRCHGSLEAVVEEVQALQSADRLSEGRVRACVPDSDPDFARLLRLSTHGMDMLVADDFVPNLHPPPLRALYKRVSKAVNKLVEDLWRDELVLLLPTTAVLQIPDVHFSAAHWAKKSGKRSGRPIFDSSNAKVGHSLNSVQARDKLEELYGPIEHPTLYDIVTMVLREGDEHGLDNLVLWKCDLSRAFSLLSYNRSDVRLLACELTDGVTLLYHSGLFGWCGTPFAFQVVTRVLKRLLTRVLTGSCLLYVDDVIAVSPAAGVEADKVRAADNIQGLLGPRAIASDKWAQGRRLDVIGWTVDLDLQTVFIKRTNFLKALHGFLTVDVHKPVAVETIECLASWASRYSEVIRILRPYTSALYKHAGGDRHVRSTRQLCAAAKETVLLWQFVLVLAECHETTFSRTLSSFRDESPRYQLMYDASLTGIGVTLHDKGSGVLRTVFSSTFPFVLPDSSFQNLAEFVAIVMGCAVLIRLGVSHCTLGVKGDSVSSLVWAGSERFRGNRATKAAAVFVALCSLFDLWVTETEHLAGTANVTHDRLSRGETPENLGFSRGEIFRLEEDPVLMAIFGLCAPGEDELLAHWGAVSDEVRKLKC